MRIFRTTLHLGVLLIPLTLLVIGFIRYAHKNQQDFQGLVKALVIEQMYDQTGLRGDYSEYKINPETNAVTLLNVKLYDPVVKRLIATSSSLTIENPQAFLNQDEPVKIHFDNTYLYISRSESGVLNISEYLKHKKKLKPSKVKIELTFKNGNVEFDDHFRQFESHFISDVASARVQIQGGNGRFACIGASSSLGSFKANGVFNSPDWVLVNIESQDLTWEAIKQYIPDSFPAQINKGVFSVKGLAAYQKSNAVKPLSWEFDFSGFADNLKLRRELSPINNVKVYGKILDYSAEFKATGNTEKAEVAVAGKAEYKQSTGSNAIHFDMLLTAQGVNPALLWKTFNTQTPPPLAGKFYTQARMSGSGQDFVVAGIGSTDSLNYNEWSLDKIKADYIYNQKRGSIIQISSAEIKGGTVKGRIDIQNAVGNKQTQISAFGSFENVNFRDIAAFKDFPLDAYLNGKIIAIGDMLKPKLAIDVTSNSLVMENKDIGSARARIEGDFDKFDIKAIEIENAGGKLIASGYADVKNSQISLALDTNGILLGRISIIEKYTEKMVDGRLYVHGLLSGPFDNPIFTGQGQLYDGTYGDYKLDLAVGEIIAGKDSLKVISSDFYHGGAVISMIGKVDYPDTDNPSFDLDVSGNNIPLSEAADFAKSEIPVKGLVTIGGFHVGGTLQSPIILGQLISEGRVTFDKMEFDKADADFVYSEDTLTINNISLATSEGMINAFGTYNKEGVLDISSDVYNFNLKSLSNYIKLRSDMESEPVSIEGIVNATLLISGNTDSPKLKAEKLNLSDIVVNGLELGKGSGELNYKNDQITVDKLIFESNGSSIALSDLNYDVALGNFSLGVNVKRYPIETIAQLKNFERMGIEPELLSRLRQMKGNVDISAKLNYKNDKLLANGDLHLSELVFSGSNAGNFNTLWKYSSDGLEINQAKWVFRDGLLIADGKYTDDGNISGNADISGFDLSWLNEFITDIPPVGGLLDATIIAEGTQESPIIKLSLNANDLKYGDFAIDNTMFGLIEYSDNIIRTDGAVVSHKGYSGGLSGRVPFDWKKMRIPDDQPLSAEMSLDNQSLRIIELFTTALDMSRTSGNVNAAIKLNGTLKHPVLSGYTEIKNGIIASSQFNGYVKDFNVKLDYSGDMVNVSNLTMRSSEGGVLAGKGSINLSNYPSGSINLDFLLDNLKINEKKISDSYSEPVKGTINGDLKLSGTLGKPVINSNLLLSDSIINLPTDMQDGEYAWNWNINPKLAILVSVGKNVTIKNPRFNAVIEGDAEINGYASAPKAKISLDIIKGTAGFPGVIVKLKPESVIDINYEINSSMASSLRTQLDLIAETSLVDRSASGDYQRYQIALKISGRLSENENLKIEAESDPPGLSEDRIFALIGRQDAFTGLMSGSDTSNIVRSQLKELFSSYALPTLWEPIQQRLTEGLQLEEFSLTSDEVEPLAIWLTKRLINNVYIRYHKAFSSRDDIWDLKLSYRLPFKQGLLSRFNISWSYDWQEQNRIMLEANMKF